MNSNTSTSNGNGNHNNKNYNNGNNGASNIITRLIVIPTTIVKDEKKKGLGFRLLLTLQPQTHPQKP